MMSKTGVCLARKTPDVDPERKRVCTLVQTHDFKLFMFTWPVCPIKVPSVPVLTLRPYI